MQTTNNPGLEFSDAKDLREIPVGHTKLVGFEIQMK